MGTEVFVLLRVRVVRRSHGTRLAAACSARLACVLCGALLGLHCSLCVRNYWSSYEPPGAHLERSDAARSRHDGLVGA